MKKHLLFLIMILHSLAASADSSGKCGNNLRWSYEEATSTLSISGEGEMNNYIYERAPWYSFKENIQNLIINDGLTSIGDEAFYGLDKISKVTIPNSVVMIGTNSFGTCYNLSAVSLSNNLMTIGSGAFNSGKIEEIFIPSSVVSIGDNAFSSSYLKSIKVDKENTKYDSRNDCNCIIETATNTLLLGCSKSTIPKGVTKVDFQAFARCNFEELILPSTINTIGNFAFQFCKIGNIFIPNSLKEIGSGAFKGATISKVTISSLGDWCNIDFRNSQSNPLYCSHHLFLGEEEIINLTIPDNVSSIGEYNQEIKGKTNVEIIPVSA